METNEVNESKSPVEEMQTYFNNIKQIIEEKEKVIKKCLRNNNKKLESFEFLEHNEKNNKLLTNVLNTITIGSFISLFGRFLDTFSNINNIVTNIPLIIIFFFLFILSFFNIGFYYKFISKINENKSGNLFTIIVCIIPTILIFISISYKAQFFFISIVILFIWLKTSQLTKSIKRLFNDNDTETIKYIKRIRKYYLVAFLVSLLTLVYSIIIWSGYSQIFSNNNLNDKEKISYIENIFTKNIAVRRFEINKKIIDNDSLKISLIQDTAKISIIDYDKSNSQHLNTLNNSEDKITIKNLRITIELIVASIIILLSIGFFIFWFKKVYPKDHEFDKVLKELDDKYKNENSSIDKTTNGSGSNIEDKNKMKLNRLNAIIPLLTILRPFISLVAGISSISVYISSSGTIEPLKIVGLLLVISLTFSFGFVINDIIDKNKDAIDHKQRPIPSGKIKIKYAWLIAFILPFISIFLSSIFSYEIILINLGAILLLSVYSYINNKFGIIANAITALVSASTIIVGMLAGAFSFPILVIAIATFFLIFGREIILDIRDIKSDSSIGKTSAPIKYGIKKSLDLVFLFFICTSIALIISAILKSNIYYSLIIGVIANILLWYSYIQYRNDISRVKLERFLVITRIVFLLILPALLLSSFIH